MAKGSDHEHVEHFFVGKILKTGFVDDKGGYTPCGTGSCGTCPDGKSCQQFMLVIPPNSGGSSDGWKGYNAQKWKEECGGGVNSCKKMCFCTQQSLPQGDPCTG